MTSTDAALALFLGALFTAAYKLGHHHKAAEQRARGFIEGWNAAVDASGRAERVEQPEAPDMPSFKVGESHHNAQLRVAQNGWQ